MLDEDENWESIPGYPNYSVSNFGRVWSHRSNRVLKPQMNRGGYLKVTLYNGRGMTTKIVHSLVAEVFLMLDEFEVDHQDGDKTYNYVLNLEPVTSKENHRRAFATGLRDQKFQPQPVRCLDTGNISAVVRGRAKATKGYRFELIDL